MNKPAKAVRVKLKIIYWGLVIAGFICIILPLLFFIKFFNHNKIQQLINNQLVSNNYSVQIEGKISPYLWKGLHLELNNINIYSHQRLLANIKHIHSEISWLHLIIGKVVINRILIDGVNTYSNNSLPQNLNYITSSILKHVNHIDILHIKNHTNNGKINLNNTSIHINLINDQRILTLKFNLPKYNTTITTSAIITLIDNQLSLINGKSLLSTNDNGLLHITYQASYNLITHILKVTNINGQVNHQGTIGLINADQVIFQPKNIIIKEAHYFSELAKTTNDSQSSINIDLEQAYSSGDYKFSSPLVNVRYNKQINKTTSLHTLSTLTNVNINTYMSQITSICNNVAQVNDITTIMQPYTAILNGECNYSYKQNALDLNLTGEINDSTINLVATYTNTNSPELKIKTKLESLTLPQSIIDKLPKLDFFHNQESIPLQNLFKLKLDSELTIKHLRLSDTLLDNFNSQVVINESQLSINRLEANYYQGSIALKAKINKNVDKFNIILWQKLTNIDLNNFFDEFLDIHTISGGQSSIELNADIPQVSTYSDIVKRFNGRVDISAKNGAIQGININTLLMSNPNTLNITNPSTTLFTHLQSSWQFKNGISTDNNLNFYSPYFFASGSGEINFNQTNINYKLNIHSNLPHNIDRIASVIIPISMHGNLFDPQLFIGTIQFNKDKLTKAIRYKTKNNKHNKKSFKHNKLSKHKHRLRHSNTKHRSVR